MPSPSGSDQSTSPPPERQTGSSAAPDQAAGTRTDSDGGSSHRGHRMGIDIGGTFTDLCVLDENGIAGIEKVLTTRDEPARAVETALRRAVGERPEAVTDLVHGTTLVTNALIERTGQTTALLATAGFSDILEMAREHRYELYDLNIELPRPLVRRHLRFDVPERILADGTVATALDEDFVRRLGRELVANEVGAVAVCYLHSFTNGTHELRTRELLAEVAPSLRVALSSEVVPEIREYERASTTVANVYVADRTERYLADLRDRVAAAGVPAQPRIMLSHGGVATVDTAARFPIRMLESGPAGGALAAAAFGSAAGFDDLLAFDMGGTTAKLCVISGGEPLVTHRFEVDRRYRLLPGSGLPVNVPVVDMIEIGVGGGSLADTNALGLLAVGPESAGSEPGPVCYSAGGTQPTVTDADVVLGYLDPEYFLGGRMRLDADAAWSAIERQIAKPLGLSVPAAAWGIHTTVNADMANAARVHTIERGADPATLPMVAFGGAGPVHAAGVAAGLGTRRVVAPPAAGVLSSIGFLTAPLAFDFVRSARGRVAELTRAGTDEILAKMEAEGAAVLADSGVGADEIGHQRFADMRFVGQGTEIRVRVPAGDSGSAEDSWRQELTDAFNERYRHLYGRSGPTVDIEVLTWRVVSSGPAPRVRFGAWKPSGDPKRKGSRQAYFPAAGGDGSFRETDVYDRYALAAGDRLAGPALVEERESTLVLPPGGTCVVSEQGSLLLDLPGTDSDEETT